MPTCALRTLTTVASRPCLRKMPASRATNNTPLRSFKPPNVKTVFCGADAAWVNVAETKTQAKENKINPAWRMRCSSALFVERIDVAALIELFDDGDIHELLGIGASRRGISLADLLQSELDSLDRGIRLFEKYLSREVVTVLDLFHVTALGIAGDDVHGKFLVAGRETHSLDHPFDEALDDVPRVAHVSARGHQVAVERLDSQLGEIE